MQTAILEETIRGPASLSGLRRLCTWVRMGQRGSGGNVWLAGWPGGWQVGWLAEARNCLPIIRMVLFNVPYFFIKNNDIVFHTAAVMSSMSIWIRCGGGCCTICMQQVVGVRGSDAERGMACSDTFFVHVSDGRICIWL